MYSIYMDSGTSNTRAYLLQDFQLLDTASEQVGTKDSAIHGSNDILIRGMKDCCCRLLEQNHLNETDIENIWVSGMVTNVFGIVEVPHISTPVDGKKLLDHVYTHYEEKYFKRNLYLICGAKTAQPGQTVSMENISLMNNVRGEEIEAVGLAASGILPKDAIVVSPGSHTHLLHVVDGAITDLVSNFTGELNYAIKKETILGGELSALDLPLNKKYVLEGYRNLKEYGISRALYIIHATKVFGICDDLVRSSMMAGLISGSVIDMLKLKIEKDWSNAEKIVILGKQNYIASYQMISEAILPEIPVERIQDFEGKSFALCGFLELLRLKQEEERK